jgi:hypothetical protein
MAADQPEQFDGQRAVGVDARIRHGAGKRPSVAVRRIAPS